MNEIEQVEAIYEAYPRKVGRRAALRAIENAIKRISAHHGHPGTEGIDLQLLDCRRWLCRRVMEYAKSPAGQKPSDPALEFRPHPSTWFNQDRFYDDPAEWQKLNGSRNGKHATIAADSETIARANAKVAELGGNHLRAR